MLGQGYGGSWRTSACQWGKLSWPSNQSLASRPEHHHGAQRILWHVMQE